MEEEKVNSREELINTNAWSSITASEYLKAMAAWLEDRDDIILKPSWSSFAKILYAGKIYD